MDENRYPFKIEINGARANEDQQWRINRIYMIIGYAQALADIDKNKNFHKKIKSIYDDKGNLTITWINKPTAAEKKYLHISWESIVTDYESNPMEHLIN